MKCWINSAVNLQQGSCNISRRTLNVSLHYLVINMLLMYLTQYHRFVSKH